MSLSEQSESKTLLSGGSLLYSGFMNKLKIGSIYEHYKGNRYEVITIACHSETLEKMVVYRALYGDKELWVRPLEMFLENVVIEGKKIPRFKFIKN